MAELLVGGMSPRFLDSNAHLYYATLVRRQSLAFCLAAMLALPTRGVVGAATTDVLVTSAADVINGDTAGVASLLANPGADGVSLREALTATNNDPGTRTIRFGPALKGRTITLTRDLPPLSAGNVAIEGDIDGDGRPDVTLARSADFTQACPNASSCGIQIASSGNRIHGLALNGFGIGVAIEDWQPAKGPPLARRTFSDNSITGVVMNGTTSVGVQIGTAYNDTCGLDSGRADPCWTYQTYSNNTISGNTIQAAAGIKVNIRGAGDRAQNITVTDNIVQMTGGDVGIGAEIGSNATAAVISGVLIARNALSGAAAIGIEISSGQRATNTVIEQVRVLDNDIRLTDLGKAYCCQGIVANAGADEAWAMRPEVLPRAWPDANETRQITVQGNRVSGPLVWGIAVQAGLGGAAGSRNSAHDIQVRANRIVSRTPSSGVMIVAGGFGDPVGRAFADGNRVSDVTVEANRISAGKDVLFPAVVDAGVVVLGGWAHNGSISNVQIVNNAIGPDHGGVAIIGGDQGAIGNKVAGVHVVNNSILSGESPSLRLSSNDNPDKGTSGNALSDITVLNTVLWGALVGEIPPSAIRSSLVQSGVAGVNGNLVGDPRFVDPPNGDLHLLAGSPAIDAGTPDGAPATDLDGQARSDGRVDIGAYEYRMPLPVVASCGTSSGGAVEERIGAFWRCVDALAPGDRLAAADLGQWARNVIERDPNAGLRAAAFRASTGTMQAAIDSASRGIPTSPPAAADVEQRIAAFWQRLNALGDCDLLSAADLGRWALNVIDRDPSRQIRIDDFRATTRAMQTALELAPSPCP